MVLISLMVKNKMHTFNFFEDWAIFYKLSKENEEILTYGGLTKQLNT